MSKTDKYVKKYESIPVHLRILVSQKIGADRIIMNRYRNNKNISIKKKIEVEKSIDEVCRMVLVLESLEIDFGSQMVAKHVEGSDYITYAEFSGYAIGYDIKIFTEAANAGKITLAKAKELTQLTFKNDPFGFKLLISRHITGEIKLAEL